MSQVSCIQSGRSSVMPPPAGAGRASHLAQVAMRRASSPSSRRSQTRSRPRDLCPLQRAPLGRVSWRFARLRAPPSRGIIPDAHPLCAAEPAAQADVSRTLELHDRVHRRFSMEEDELGTQRVLHHNAYVSCSRCGRPLPAETAAVVSGDALHDHSEVTYLCADCQQALAVGEKDLPTTAECPGAPLAREGWRGGGPASLERGKNPCACNSARSPTRLAERPRA